MKAKISFLLLAFIVPAYAISQTVSVYYDVPLIPQPTKLSCWAGSMAMVVNYQDKQSISPESIANASGVSLFQSYGWSHLEAVRDQYNFKSVIEVPEKTTVYYPPQYWYDWLVAYGPLWYTVIWTENGSSHAMVVTGMEGDLADAENLKVYINNPWNINTTFDSDPTEFNPANSGAKQQMSFTEFAKYFGTWGYSNDRSSWRIMYRVPEQ